MPDSARSIRTEVMEGIALLTFNVPPRNAACATDLGNVADVLGRYAEDPAIRVVVLTGAGYQAFVTDPEAEDMEDIAEHAAACNRAQDALAAFPKPVIARIRGDCIGAGLLLALHADLLIAAEDSAFALPAARWGSAYTPATVAALVGLVGPQQAKQLLLTGWQVEARQALQIGLVTMVVPDGDLSDTVVDLAREIADNAPLAVTAMKRMVAHPGDRALGSLVEACRVSQDHQAGIAARKKGRRPAFSGQ